MITQSVGHEAQWWLQWLWWTAILVGLAPLVITVYHWMNGDWATQVIHLQLYALFKRIKLFSSANDQQRVGTTFPIKNRHLKVTIAAWKTRVSARRSRARKINHAQQIVPTRHPVLFMSRIFKYSSKTLCFRLVIWDSVEKGKQGEMAIFWGF